MPWRMEGPGLHVLRIFTVCPCWCCCQAARDMQSAGFPEHLGTSELQPYAIWFSGAGRVETGWQEAVLPRAPVFLWAISMNMCLLLIQISSNKELPIILLICTLNIYRPHKNNRNEFIWLGKQRHPSSALSFPLFSYTHQQGCKEAASGGSEHISTKGKICFCAQVM